jgi:hypothetical protein
LLQEIYYEVNARNPEEMFGMVASGNGGKSGSFKLMKS